MSADNVERLRVELAPEDLRWVHAQVIAVHAADAITALLAGTSAAMPHDIRSTFNRLVCWRREPTDPAELARTLADLTAAVEGATRAAG